jgi:glycosyltransferase involved in cell wall biosynthesis
VVARRLAEEAYSAADIVTSVCVQNGRLQIALGADPARVRVIPNGAPATPVLEHSASEAIWVGMVGRVVGVKDVHTFLRSCALVADQRSDVRFAVVGPLDHEPAYVERCLALAGRLGLGSRLVFTGETDPNAWYRRLDILCLTSVSEAQPLVVLEAMAAGLPVVCTEVGDCADLVGPAGIVTAPGAPKATADALLRLCADRALRERLGTAARARARQRHDPDTVHQAYRRLYSQLAA